MRPRAVLFNPAKEVPPKEENVSGSARADVKTVAVPYKFPLEREIQYCGRPIRWGK
jgi:hypothetical protein